MSTNDLLARQCRNMEHAASCDATSAYCWPADDAWRAGVQALAAEAPAEYKPRVPMHVAQDAAADEATNAQAALVALHDHAFDSWVRNTCTCGRTFHTPQALGLHRGAVRRQADKLWDTTYEAALVRAGY